MIVQYVVLRSDLWKSLEWPLGSIVAQACHAATAALWLRRNEENSLAYCADSNLDHMHKVLLKTHPGACFTDSSLAWALSNCLSTIHTPNKGQDTDHTAN